MNEIVKDFLLILCVYSVYAYQCQYSCLTCSGSTSNDCLTCSEGQVTPAGQCTCSLPVYQNGVCLNACTDGYEQQGDECRKCSGNCKTCFNSACQSCYDNYKIVENSFCQPYCEQGSYFLSESCISLLSSTSEVIYYAFNEDKNQCEVKSTDFLFDPIFYTAGDNCKYFNGYLIFGNNYIWHSRKGTLYIQNLKDHSNITLYMKIFYVDQWNVGDRFNVTLDTQIIYDYNVTNNNWGPYLEQNIKQNINHISNNLTLTLHVRNQGGTGYIGITDLQIIMQKCGCDCDINGCVSDSCLSNQIQIQNACINCDNLPNRLADCNCMEGYYQNSQTSECLKCNQNCLTCVYTDSFCQSCNLQYQTPPLCDCSNTLINGFVTLSNNIPQIKITLSEAYTVRSQKCNNIFQDETFLLLGENPICQYQDINGNQSISVFLGNKYTFIIHNQIKLNNNNIILLICQTSNSIINLQQTTQEFQMPYLVLSTSKLLMSQISNETIYYYTQQQLNNFQWTIVDFKTDFETIYQLLNTWNLLISNSKYFPISGDLFKVENQFTLEFKFCNFLNICNQVQLEVIIQLNFKSFLHINLQYKKDLYYQQEFLQFMVQTQVQIEDQLIQSNDPTNISYTLTGNDIQIENQVTINPEAFYIITIDPNFLKVLEMYQLDLQVKNGDLTNSQQVQFILANEPIQVTIKGGNRIQSYLEQFKLSILKNNKDVYNSDLCQTCNPFSLIIWKCMDLSLNSDCLDLYNKTINLEQNITILIIEKNLFTPYKVVEFQLNAIINNQIYTDQITVYFVEENIPNLIISTDNQNSISNCYDDKQFEVDYSDKVINSDLLSYKGMIIQDYQIVSYFIFNYTTFQIRLSNYYHLTKDRVLLYRFAVYNPNFLIPSLYSIPLKFNSPPQQCNIKIVAFNQLYLITIDDCIDSDIPLQYRFSVYFNDPVQPFYETKINERILLSDYSFNNSYTTNLFGNNIIVGVEVKDIYNGINNFITSFEINTLSNNDISLSEFDDLNKVYQMFYYLQYLINNTLFLTEQQLESLVKYQNQINTSEISNMQLFYINHLLLGLVRQQDQQFSLISYYEYWNASIEYLKLEIDNFIEYKNSNSYFQQLEIDLYIFNLYLSFSYWFQLELRNIQFNGRRLLLNESSSDSILKLINEVSKQQLLMQLANGQQLTKYTEQFNISTMKFTNAYVNTSEININVSANTIIQESKIKFKDNIYRNSIEFNNIINDSFPLYYIQISSSNSSDQIYQLNGSLYYEFDVDDSNQNYQCAIKTESWSLNECNSTLKNKKVICECSKLGPTTIVQVFINLKDNILNLFTQTNLDRIKDQNYFLVIFTYIEIIFLLIFIFYLYFGKQLDISQKQIKIKSQSNNQVFPCNIGDNQLPYEKQPSLKTFNYSSKNQILKILEPDERLSEQNNCPSVKIEQVYSIDNGMSSPKSIDNFISVKAQQNSELDNLTRFLLFYKNYHKILALYFRYDEKSSRPVRLTQLYLSILGQMGLVNWFGEVFDINVMLELSVFTYIFGLLYKKTLSFFLMNKFLVLQQLGNLLASTSAIFFIFITISSIPLYGSTQNCNIWALGFITGFILDFLVYTSIQILLMQMVMTLLVKKSLFRRVLKKLIDSVSYSIITQEYQQQN